MKSSIIWVLLRSFIFVGAIGMVLQISTSVQPKSNWLERVVSPFVVSLFLFIALFIGRSKQDVTDLSKPWSLAGPFLPFSKIPFRAWFTFSWMMVGASVIGVVFQIARKQQLLPINLMFFLGYSAIIVLRFCERYQ
jgi:hypothetical protein